MTNENAVVLAEVAVGVTLFVTSVDAIALPHLMWMGIKSSVDPEIAAISLARRFWPAPQIGCGWPREDSEHRGYLP